MRRRALVAETRGATMVLWFAEAVWMVFLWNTHTLWDQSRSMWTQAVMCKGLKRELWEAGTADRYSQVVWGSKGWGRI